MPLPINELGEFILHDEVDGELERRKRIYGSCAKVGPMHAAGSKPCYPPKPKEPKTARCMECGATFEKKRRNQMFCCRKCQKANYNAERRL